LGNGNGTFQPIANLSGTTNPVSLTVGDFNNDGKPDLAIADQGTWPSNLATLPTGGGIAVYLGKGNGSFQSPVNYTAGIDPAFVIAADVNADQTPDLMVGTFDLKWSTNGQSDVAVLLGNGNGTFKAASYFATEEAPNSIAVADFNGDGKPDLAIAHCCTNTFATVMLGNGDGTFQAEGVVPSAFSPSTVAAADLNGDGKPDLIAALAQYSQSYVGIFLNVATPLPNIAAVTNAASYATGTVSPGEMVTLFGASIGPATPAYATIDPSTGKLATTIGGVQVLFNGTPAPMIYASATQISAVVPYEMASVANPSVSVNYSNQTSNAYPLTAAATAPGLFTQNSSGSGLGCILNQDYSVNGPNNPAAKGTIVMLYLTGEGQTNPPSVTGVITTATLPPPQVTPAPARPVTVTINGQPATYVYAGEAPGFVAGLMQLNVQIPSNAPSGNLSIAMSIGGNPSQNGVTVSVK
jgi:uncharacterized protein (TIGR03437 family)